MVILCMDNNTTNISKRIPWNKGLTKESDERVKKNADSIRLSWNEENIRQRTTSYKKSMVKKYGVENSFQINDIKNKIKKKLIEKYGVDNPTKSNVIREKTKKTKFQKYGNENYNNMEKNTQTMLKRYGVKSPSQMEGYFEKWTKSGVKRKSYILPSGKEIKLQGYENYALNKMLKTYTENDIFESHPPKIKFLENNNKHIFYPDFYIKKDNLIIEIKSRFTYNRWLSKNNAKIEACKNQGYKIQYWIIDKKGNLEEII